MGIPLGDDNPQRKGIPITVILLIGINVLVFLYQISLGSKGFALFTMQFGAIPYELLTNKDLPPYSGLPVYATLFTSMFMHANWMHLLGNMLYMWVFADNLEYRMGTARFIVFYLLCGVAAGVAQTLLSLWSGSQQALLIPCVGASGAIAGVMGGYMVLFPRAHVYTLFAWIGIIPIPAWWMLGIWILTQVLSGVSSFGGVQLGGVAYAAHVGGFILGLILVKLFDKGARGATYINEDLDF